ncbi:hypothetical protein BCU36_025180 (plasmid) [Vibrio lentus]|uniref:hypothetical protein n=1 Tax=Vibrio lentus TaxID=136468 RepID=UPI000C84C417|nr:hypothetical protein [Vibrio lentus]PMI81711.1 hypothetical protein BCU36_11720 [Vibrio lentus]
MPNITEELQELKKASQAQTSASQQLADEVSQKMGAIDKKTNDSIAKQKKKVEEFIATATPASIDAEGRFYVDITVKGDKDTFYPVYFRMPSSDSFELEIYRHYSWNNNSRHVDERSDFDVSHVSGVLVSLVGQTYSWSGDANFLRTLVNCQRYKQTVANVGFLGYASAHKVNSDLPDTMYTEKDTGFICNAQSSFHLRGGNLKYRIYTNHKIPFSLKRQGEVVYKHAAERVNVEWRAVELNVADIVTGDSKNNHKSYYISYPVSAATKDVDIDALVGRVNRLEAKGAKA